MAATDFAAVEGTTGCLRPWQFLLCDTRRRRPYIGYDRDGGRLDEAAGLRFDRRGELVLSFFHDAGIRSRIGCQ